jgi:predicted TPR repeat methyltransferase
VTKAEQDPAEVMRLLLAAQSAHRQGLVAEAESLYGACLAGSPRNPDVLHFYGMLQFQVGMREQGLQRVRESLDVEPCNPHAWNNLGNMLVASDDADGAIEAYRRATALEPRLAVGWYNLGIVLRQMRRIEECVAAFCNALDLEPSDGAVYERFGMILYALGRFEQAADVYRRWLKVDPANPLARHMFAAMTGEQVPERAGDDYVARLFDEFSDSFDAQLRNLEYRAPELLSAAVLGELPAGQTQAVLDAGCGTGLCGPLLRSAARHLVGVDLSAGMIARARERQLYDELHVAELTAFIAAHPRAFDVIISADTLVYFGALEAFAAAAAAGLRERGLLGFTVERRDEGDAPYMLEPHGRYSHRPQYVESVLRAAGFNLVEERHAVLRKESGKDVAGLLVVARLQAPGTGIANPAHSLA